MGIEDSVRRKVADFEHRFGPLDHRPRGADLDDYDTKPVDLERLIGKIGRLLGTANDEALCKAV
jgi:hypothetical protein